jgi:hypothetical protein
MFSQSPYVALQITCIPLHPATLPGSVPAKLLHPTTLAAHSGIVSKECLQHDLVDVV